ncbi:MAG: hypothetical protein OER90_19235, partial [Gemmatimonadota bacterium]|nr:hypothetical protein [Gemmatimonadota bacterium]
MSARLPRRRRLLLLTAAFGVFFVGAAVVAVWLLSRPEPTYRPGERVAGLKADLDRSVPGDHPRVTFVNVTQE